MFHSGIDRPNLLFGDQATTYTRLVGDNDQGELLLVQLLNGLLGSGQEFDFLGIAQVGDVFDQRVVAVKEDGGFTHGGGPPPGSLWGKP